MIEENQITTVRQRPVAEASYCHTEMCLEVGIYLETVGAKYRIGIL